MKDSDKPAKDFIKLYTKDLGSVTNRRIYYFAENTSVNRAIKVTIRYWDTRLTNPTRYTKSYEIEPGELKQLDPKSLTPRTTIYAAISGARYLC